MAQSPNNTAGFCRCKSTQIRRREAEDGCMCALVGMRPQRCFVVVSLGVYASLKSRNVSAKPRSCCQILPDHVHVMSDFGSSTLTATLLLREAQGEVSKHYSSSRTKCGATQTSKHIQLQSQLPQCCRCDQEAQVKCIFLCQIFTNYLRWNCSMKWFFQREGLIFALVLLRVSKLACSVKISPMLRVIKPSGAGCDQWPPSQTYGSQWGLACFSTHCSCCWRGLCQ